MYCSITEADNKHHKAYAKKEAISRRVGRKGLRTIVYKRRTIANRTHEYKTPAHLPSFRRLKDLQEKQIPNVDEN